MGTKYCAFGTQLKMGDGADPEVFATVANVRSIGGPGLEKDVVDTTAHDSPGGWEEVCASIKRSGEVSLEILYDPADATHDDATGLLSKFNTQVGTWQIIWPDDDSTPWAFDGFVKGFEPDAPHDDALAATVAIKLTGQPSFV
jgi:predicted secreted protein